jgi:hypothetical protein
MPKAKAPFSGLPKPEDIVPSLQELAHALHIDVGCTLKANSSKKRAVCPRRNVREAAHSGRREYISPNFDECCTKHGCKYAAPVPAITMQGDSGQAAQEPVCKLPEAIAQPAPEVKTKMGGWRPGAGRPRKDGMPNKSALAAARQNINEDNVRAASPHGAAVADLAAAINQEYTFRVHIKRVEEVLVIAKDATEAQAKVSNGRWSLAPGTGPRDIKEEDSVVMVERLCACHTCADCGKMIMDNEPSTTSGSGKHYHNRCVQRV